MSFEIWIAFALASLVLAISPGPDNLFVLMQSALHGRAAGLWVVLGLCSGLVVHTTAVVIGVAALVQESPLAFNLLKLAGAAYLLWLAWGAWRAPVGEGGPAEVPAASPARLWLRGVVMNLTNPKVLIFFLALFPQFLNAAAPAAPQLVLMGATFIVATLLVFGGIAWVAGTARDRLTRPAVQRWLNRSAAGVFAALALRLAAADV